MKDKKLKIKIAEDGSVFAETIGIKGKDCLEYIELLEELLDAETVDSRYTEEYYETGTLSVQRKNQLWKEE
ncbi:DUF2997 domain-containing protein [Siminovitchia sediminis]|uniref:DUF2997 domain-containing protein n=1 Tax=Siminovitchia sediminis TaxID=1274353 RepID=A0ABW4KF14_9BACI